MGVYPEKLTRHSRSKRVISGSGIYFGNKWGARDKPALEGLHNDSHFVLLKPGLLPRTVASQHLVTVETAPFIAPPRLIGKPKLHEFRSDPARFRRNLLELVLTWLVPDPLCPTPRLSYLRIQSRAEGLQGGGTLRWTGLELLRPNQLFAGRRGTSGRFDRQRSLHRACANRNARH